MGFQDLTPEEVELVLEKERVIRIAFSAEGETFVVPVFYVWHEGALCGLTTPGRKTRLGEANPEVAFQIDSTFVTGPWEWASVAGQGAFSRIAQSQMAPMAAKLQLKLQDAPDWAAKLLQDRFARFGIYAWRIEPRDLSGRAHGPD